MQLRNFARVKVSPEIKLAVEQALRVEEVDRYMAKSQLGSGQDDDDETHSSPSSSSSSSLASHDSEIDNQGAALSDDRRGNELSRNTAHSMLDKRVLLNVSSLILTPHRAPPLESRWLDEILSRFPVSNNNHTAEDDLRGYWPSFVKYFNGSDALEKIPGREGLKRKLAWQVLVRLGAAAAGSSMNVDSSSSADPARERVLLSVRHW